MLRDLLDDCRLARWLQIQFLQQLTDLFISSSHSHRQGSAVRIEITDDTSGNPVGYAEERSKTRAKEWIAFIPALMQSQDRSWQRGCWEDSLQPASPRLPEARQPDRLWDRLAEPEKAWSEACVYRQ